MMIFRLLLFLFLFFKEIALVCCEGFGTRGLAILASKSRLLLLGRLFSQQLRVLDLFEDEVNDDEVDWISCFPEGETCLESLTFDCVETPGVEFPALEKLLARSPNLKKLRLNRYVSIGQLHRLMARAPQLTHLGTGSFSPSENADDAELQLDYSAAFAACRSIVCLLGFREIVPEFLPAIYPVWANLTSLNFSYVNINAEQLKPFICNYRKSSDFLGD